MVTPTPNVQEGAVEVRRLTTDEMLANRKNYVPAPDAVEYDGPMDDGEPQPSCYRKWQRSRDFIFAKSDLALLDEKGDLPTAFQRAVSDIIGLVKEPSELYPSTNPNYGRFSFSDGARTAHQARAAFRVLRAAIDFLEDDYESCEAEEIIYLREKLANFEALKERGY